MSRKLVEVTGETPLLRRKPPSLGQVVEQRLANGYPERARTFSTSPPSLLGGSAGKLYGTPVGKNPFDFAKFQWRLLWEPERGVSGRPAAQYRLYQPAAHHSDPGFDWEFKVQYNNLGPEWGKFFRGRHQPEYSVRKQ